MDYGNSSPDTIIIFYKNKSSINFFEVKRISGLDHNNEWYNLITWEEVNEINEVLQLIILIFFHFIF